MAVVRNLQKKLAHAVIKYLHEQVFWKFHATAIFQLPSLKNEL